MAACALIKWADAAREITRECDFNVPFELLDKLLARLAQMASTPRCANTLK